MKTNKKTILQPKLSQKNEYVNIVNQIISELGYTDIIDASESIKIKNLFSPVSISYFAWFENTDTNSKFLGYIQNLKKKLYIRFFKHVKRTKIIIAIHNKTSHLSGEHKQTLTMLKWLCKKSDSIIILCHETNQYLLELFGEKEGKNICNKCFYIPHPNYIGIYGNEDITENNKYYIPQDDKFNLLFLGTLKPYKNIEIIIDAANMIKEDNIRFIIAGHGDKDYVDSLQRQIKGNNVLFYPYKIPNEIMGSFISMSDIMLLPYNLDSVLNSGVCILAFSHKKNVISTTTGTLNEFPRELVYSYSFEGDGHVLALYTEIQKAYNDYTLDRESFLEKQNALYKCVSDYNSYENVKKKYEKLYTELERK